MAILKKYTNSPLTACSFGANKNEAIQNKDALLRELKASGNIIVPGYDDPQAHKDATLRKLKSAKGDYQDIYGNITKYWKPIFE